MLELEGIVEIDFDGGHGRLVADRRRLVLEVARPSDLIGLGNRRSARALGALLDRAGLTLDVRTRDRLLFTAGRGVHGGALGRLLGLPHLRVTRRFGFRAALPRGRARA